MSSNQIDTMTRLPFNREAQYSNKMINSVQKSRLTGLKLTDNDNYDYNELENQPAIDDHNLFAWPRREDDTQVMVQNQPVETKIQTMTSISTMLDDLSSERLEGKGLA